MGMKGHSSLAVTGDTFPLRTHLKQKWVDKLLPPFHNSLHIFDEVVKSQQKDGFDVGASCGRPWPGERSSPLQYKARKN
jgi:hypothetical protein